MRYDKKGAAQERITIKKQSARERVRDKERKRVWNKGTRMINITKGWMWRLYRQLQVLSLSSWLIYFDGSYVLFYVRAL